LQTAIAGRAFRLFADVAGGQPLSYQWKINGTNIAGATNAVLRFDRLELTNSGVYTLAVTNAQGSLTSTGATLTVSRAPVYPASPDIAYFVQADGVIKAMAAQTNTGKIVIAGLFRHINGRTRNHVARLNSDVWIVGADWSNGVFDATLQTDVGKNYYLEFKDTLSDPAWTALPLLEGDGALKALSDPAANSAHRFYRARVE
jgi:hypothetical protein